MRKCELKKTGFEMNLKIQMVWAEAEFRKEHLGERDSGNGEQHGQGRKLQGNCERSNAA